MVFAMMRIMICLWFCLAASGCGKKQAAPPPPAGAAVPSQTADQTQSPDPAGAGMPTPQSPPAGAPTVQSAAASTQPATPTEQPVPVAAGDYSAVLSSLTQGLRRYGVEKQRVPASLNEVIAAGYIQAMPQPPPGRKFALDAKRMEVVLVKQ
jgi:hypothetical protein